MHKTRAQTRAFAEALLAMPLRLDAVDAVICPPFTALDIARHTLDGSGIGLGAQTMHWAESGAYTGEIAPPMLLELGVGWVILGHSERRAMCGETDHDVNAKVRAALAHGITPIVAVGETAEEHAAGHARARVEAQTRAAFTDVPADHVARCVLAYEPIWAIGSGTSDTPAQANATMGAMRAAVDGLQHARVLYGGSVKPDNIAGFVAQPNIDGGLVGGASLEPTSFAALLAEARKGALA
jgi:triosephosphate isomerase